MIKTNMHYIPFFDGTSVCFGYAAEKIMVKYLRSKYSHEYKIRRKKYAGHDIQMTHKVTGEIIRIEIKAARQGKDKKYRATTYKRNHTDYRKSDIIIFLAFNPVDKGRYATPFIIPTVTWDKNYIAITSNPQTYNGAIAKYRNAWDGLIC